MCNVDSATDAQNDGGGVRLSQSTNTPIKRRNTDAFVDGIIMVY